VDVGAHRSVGAAAGPRDHGPDPSVPSKPQRKTASALPRWPAGDAVRAERCIRTSGPRLGALPDGDGVQVTSRIGSGLFWF
jgi:hypothetical protein